MNARVCGAQVVVEGSKDFLPALGIFSHGRPVIADGSVDLDCAGEQLGQFGRRGESMSLLRLVVGS